jgi:hypothetical protein
MSIILSEKEITVLMVDGYKYGFQKYLANEIKTWTCNKKISKAYLNANLIDEIMFDVSNIIYTCTKDSEKKINRQILRNHLKRKAVEQHSERPLKLFREHILQYNISTIILTTSDVICIKNNMHHARILQYPKLPQNRIEVHTVLTSIEVDNFLLVNDVSNGLVIFSCEKILCF